MSKAIIVELYDELKRGGNLVRFARKVGERYNEGTLQRLLRNHDPQAREATLVALRHLGTMNSNEAVAAAQECEARGIQAAVVDMASIDEDLLIDLCASGKLVCLAEQNNGFILQNLVKLHYRRMSQSLSGALGRVISINTLDGDGRPRFIHSGTYEELIEAFGLTPSRIAASIAGTLNR